MDSLQEHWKAYLSTILVVSFLIWLVFFSGCVIRQDYALEHSVSTPYHGPKTLEERILLADVIIRAKLISVAAGTENIDPAGYGDGRTKFYPVGSLEYKFEALEYLKGDGDKRLTAVVTAAVWEDKSISEAIADGKVFLAERIDIWDNREEILFLRDSHEFVVSTRNQERYSLGGIDSYDIYSRHSTAKTGCQQ